jgi:hypothetical protein
MTKLTPAPTARSVKPKSPKSAGISALPSD